MLWLVVIFLLVGLLLYLLFLPLDVIVNTSDKKFFARLGYLAKAAVESDEKYLIRVRLSTLFMRFNFYPLKKRRKKEKPKTKKVTKKSQMKWSDFRLGLRLLKSFEIKRFSADVDSGNCITNAKWYPVAALFNYYGGNFNINFIGRNQLTLHLHNRPIRIIKSFINPKKLYHGITL